MSIFALQNFSDLNGYFWNNEVIENTHLTNCIFESILNFKNETPIEYRVLFDPLKMHFQHFIIPRFLRNFLVAEQLNTRRCVCVCLCVCVSSVFVMILLSKRPSSYCLIHFGGSSGPKLNPNIEPNIEPDIEPQY